jgi:hypothetical protein
MQDFQYEQAFLTQLEVYSKMFGVRWVVNLCHTFIMNSLVGPPVAAPPPPPPTPPLEVKIETDSLSEDSLLSFIPHVEEAKLLAPSPPPSPPPEPDVKILRLKKAAPLHTPTPSSPEAKHTLAQTVKKTASPKKCAAVRDFAKLVNSGLLPVGSKVIPSDTEVKPDVYGIVKQNSSGKVGIQPSWNPDTLYVGKSNVPTQFLAAVNKQFPSYKVYGRQNAWNDLLKVIPSGGYVSLAELWSQSR